MGPFGATAAAVATVRGKPVSTTLANATRPEVRHRLYAEAHHECMRYKWIVSEKACRDLGEDAIRDWHDQHWHRFVRTCWAEHVEGKRFWQELDLDDFGVVRRQFDGRKPLLEAVLAQLKDNRENLDVIVWARATGQDMEATLEILEVLDINSRRLACSIGRLAGR